MYRLTITLYKPQQTRVVMDEEDNTDVLTYVTTMAQSKLKRGRKNLPAMPKLHAQAILNITRYSIKNKRYLLLPVAQYLALHLTKHSPETVSLRSYNIQEDIGLSDKALTACIHTLEALGYIKIIGQSLYYISPKLAFYGSAIDWSLALQVEAEGGSHEEFKALQKNIKQQITENEAKHFN